MTFSVEQKVISSVNNSFSEDVQGVWLLRSSKCAARARERNAPRSFLKWQHFRSSCLRWSSQVSKCISRDNFATFSDRLLGYIQVLSGTTPLPPSSFCKGCSIYFHVDLEVTTTSKQYVVSKLQIQRPAKQAKDFSAGPT